MAFFVPLDRGIYVWPFFHVGSWCLNRSLMLHQKLKANQNLRRRPDWNSKLSAFENLDKQDRNPRHDHDRNQDQNLGQDQDQPDSLGPIPWD